MQHRLFIRQGIVNQGESLQVYSQYKTVQINLNHMLIHNYSARNYTVQQFSMKVILFFGIFRTRHNLATSVKCIWLSVKYICLYIV